MFKVITNTLRTQTVVSKLENIILYKLLKIHYIEKSWHPKQENIIVFRV